SFFRDTGQEGLRDGCRVPLPWSGDAAPYGFGDGGSWLPQPADWAPLTVAAQTGDPASTLELYRTALTLRRAHPGLGAGDAVEWLDAPDGVLAFRRPGGLVCTVNTTGAPARLPAPGRLLLSSRPLDTPEGGAAPHPSEGAFELPADTAVWWEE
ncbi:DUF3459 domain-containing protein, partial [Streptomyces sp. CA2R101]|uniref:DUF3459 domain-containing protein n=1 Tax=Streptomyces sp. CA2R101 TaxID=3120152 RepID=UPI00300AA377